MNGLLKQKNVVIGADSDDFCFDNELPSFEVSFIPLYFLSI